MKDVDIATLPQGECDINVMAGQMGGDENQQAIDLFKIIDYAWPCAVVIEDFVPQMLNKERHFLSPVRITSKLELLLWQVNRRHVKQMPSMAKSTISDEHLKVVMMFQPGMPHANDACRHGLTFLRRVVRSPWFYDKLIEPIGLDGS